MSDILPKIRIPEECEKCEFFDPDANLSPLQAKIFELQDRLEAVKTLIKEWEESAKYKDWGGKIMSAVVNQLRDAVEES